MCHSCNYCGLCGQQDLDHARRKLSLRVRSLSAVQVPSTEPSLPAKNPYSRDGISFTRYCAISLSDLRPIHVMIWNISSIICCLQSATPFTVFILALFRIGLPSIIGCLSRSLEPRGLSLPAPIVIPASQDLDGNDAPWSSFALRVGTPAQTVRVAIPTDLGCASRWLHLA